MIPGRIAASRVYKHEPYYATTLNPDKKTISFAVVNDIHGNDSLFRQLLGGVTEKNTDFVVLNGDMTSMIESERQLFDGYLRSASELFAANVPFCFVRGNHENRGAFFLPRFRLFSDADRTVLLYVPPRACIFRGAGLRRG